MEALLDKLAPHSRTEGKCAICGKDVNVETDFDDELSRREYGISRLCQACQDSVFTEFPSEEDEDEPAF